MENTFQPVITITTPVLVNSKKLRAEVDSLLTYD